MQKGKFVCSKCKKEFNSYQNYKQHIDSCSLKMKNSNSSSLLNLIAKLIIEMNITRKKVTFYPNGHPKIEEHIDRLQFLLKEIFKEKKKISLGIAKDKIFFEDIMLDPKNPGARELAEIFFNNGIIFLTISSGITTEELIKFFKRISQPPEAAKKSEKLIEFIEKEKITHLKLKMLEITELPISEEREIQIEKIPKKEFVKENFWVLLIKGLVIRYAHLVDELSSLEKGLGLSAKKLAEIINEAFELETSGKLNFPEFMDIYFEAIKKASKYPRINQDIRKKIEDFVLNLTFEKKAYFLTKNIEFSKNASLEEKELIKNLFDRIFIEVLKHAISQKEDLPQEMLSLLESSSIVTIPKKTLQKYVETVRRRKASSILKDFYRADDIVIYQPKNYQKILKDFVEKMERKDIEKPTISDINNYKQDLSEENLQTNALLILLELLDSKLNEEEYKKFLIEIKNYFDIFLMTGRFKEISLILNVLTEQEKNIKEEHEKLKILKETINQLKNPNILAQLVKELRTVWGEEKYVEIKETVLQFGKKGVNYLIELLSEEEDKFTRSLLVDLIVEFGPQALDVIEKKLDDHRWYVVRNMILILRKMEDRSLLPKIQLLCNHSNFRVKIEALKSLLYFNSPSGIHYLKKFLNNGNEFIRDSALSLAGAFKVREVIDVLLQNLKKLKMNRRDFNNKLKIVQVLGQIGDPHAIEYLRKEIRKIYLIHWRRGKELKRAIYNSLKNYPFEEVKDLVKKGLKSMDREVKFICEMLQKEQTIKYGNNRK
jgi:hypothetical protein